MRKSGKARRTTRRTRTREPWWAGLPQRELVELRLCDLGLSIEGTALEARVDKLHEELERADLEFRPYVWLSTDWFTPDGLSGFAIPFFLAHPRLARLERQHMLQVEGGTRDGCMRLLRHETGHAICNAYRLHHRKRWRELFGRFSEPYEDTYQPRPYSKRFVTNLDNWYAQSHPAEDFAETFAVWLQPGSRWWRAYDGWPAMRKLEYVDELMIEIGEERWPKSRERPESLPRQRQRLRTYWEEKRARYALDQPVEQLGELEELYSAEPQFQRRPRAAAFLRDHRASLRQRVADMSGQYRYLVDQVLDDLIERCEENELHLTKNQRESLVDAAVLLTVRVMNSLQEGYHLYSR